MPTMEMETISGTPTTGLRKASRPMTLVLTSTMRATIKSVPTTFIVVEMPSATRRSVRKAPGPCEDPGVLGSAMAAGSGYSWSQLRTGVAPAARMASM